MAITVTTFMATLAGLSITGVTEKATPPQQINVADLPVGYPRLPTSGAGMISFGGNDGLRSVSCDYVILIQPIPLNRNSTNHAAAATAMDNLHSALVTEMAANQQIDSWTMHMDVEGIGEIEYWSVIATIDASE